MDAKHTSGPWHVRDGDSRFLFVLFVDSQTEGSVCKIAVNAHSEANAHLIAAAPELLQALEHLRFTTQEGWITPEDKPTDWQLGWEAACEQFKIAKVNEEAEAAIRKATVR